MKVVLNRLLVGGCMRRMMLSSFSGFWPSTWISVSPPCSCTQWPPSYSQLSEYAAEESLPDIIYIYVSSVVFQMSPTDHMRGNGRGQTLM